MRKFQSDALTLDLPHSHSGCGPAQDRQACPIGICARGFRHPGQIFWRGIARFNRTSPNPSMPGNSSKRALPCADSLSWEDVQISSAAGELRLPGFYHASSCRSGLGAAHNNFFRNCCRWQLSLESPGRSTAKPDKSAAKPATARPRDQLEIRFRDDFIAGKGSCAVTGKLEDVSDFFRRHPLSARPSIAAGNHRVAPMAAIPKWDHASPTAAERFTDFHQAQLQAAGLNLFLEAR